MIIKSGDTHDVSWRANADLTGADVRLVIKRVAGGTPIELEAAVDAGTDGLVTHRLDGTLTPGSYQVELEATRDGAITTFPNSGQAILIVQDDLD